MGSAGRYKTKQGEDLLGYLETIPGQHVTVKEILRHFSENGQAIGTATVYRHLDALVDQGFVNKYIIDENSPACFEYIGEHEPDTVCFHCKCEKCGVLFHMHCEEFNRIREHLLKEHLFVLDTKRTVFYGICEKCKAQ